MKETHEKEVKGERDIKPYRLNLEYNREHYTRYSKQAARILYWLVLLMLTICNFLIFIILIPFILILKSTHLFLIIGAIGLVFGLIFNFLINDIEHLEPKHHRFAAAFIPIIAIINIFMLISIERFISGVYPYSNMDIFYASLIYVIMFMLPYVLGVLKKKR